MKVWRPQTAYALKQGPAWDNLLGEIASCASDEAVEAWWGRYLTLRHRDYPEGWSLALRDACEARKGDILMEADNAALDAAYTATVRGA